MLRRDFLAATLAAGLCRRSALAARQDAKPGGGLTLGFGTYAMKTWKTERAVDLIAELGFDSVELTIVQGWDADPAGMNAERRAALRKQIASRGLRLTSLGEHLNISEQDRSRQQRLDRIKLAARLGHDLSPDDPPLMQTTLGGGGDWKVLRDRYADELVDWLKVAEAEDLVIAVKPHRGATFSRPRQAAELIELLGKPKRLRICYDYSHYDFRDMPLDETIRTALPYVGHVAVKDTVMAGGRTRFVLPGEGGRIDYPRLLRLFYDGGYRGDIACEVSAQVWSQDGYDPIAAAKTCYANMAAAFEKSGVPRG